MTSKERIKKTLNDIEPDRVPIAELGIASGIASEILGREAHTGGGNLHRDETDALFQSEEAGKEFADRIFEDIIELYTSLDLDMVSLPWRMNVKPTKKIDENTFYYEDKQTGLWSLYRYISETDIFTEIDSSIRKEGFLAIERFLEKEEADIVKNNSEESSYSKDLDLLVNTFGEQKAIVGDSGIVIPIDTPWLEAFILRPELIERYLDIQLEGALRRIELLAEHKADIVIGGGDLADKNGPVYSPAHFRKFILPRLKKITALSHKVGLPYFYRTDGNTWLLARELFIESGVDGYVEIDKSAGMDLGELKQKFPHLTLVGNIDCGETLVNGRKEDVISETIDCLRKAAPGGGYILAPSNFVQKGVPAENLLIMYETAKQYGAYPIR